MTHVKAKLSVILKADDLVVEESTDPILWQRVLAAINSRSSELKVDSVGDNSPPGASLTTGSAGSAASAVDRMARQIGTDRSVLEGACSPMADPPYLHLDLHCWEDMRRQLPPRGRSAVAPIVISGTLLALWLRAAGLPNPTQAQAQAVLDTINVRDANPSRGIDRAEWLQSRSGGQIVLNPAEISKAVRLARCFSTKDWAGWTETVAS